MVSKQFSPFAGATVSGLAGPVISLVDFAAPYSVFDVVGSLPFAFSAPPEMALLSAQLFSPLPLLFRGLVAANLCNPSSLQALRARLNTLQPFGVLFATLLGHLLAHVPEADFAPVLI